jgi:hypothetical protein
MRTPPVKPFSAYSNRSVFFSLSGISGIVAPAALRTSTVWAFCARSTAVLSALFFAVILAPAFRRMRRMSWLPWAAAMWRHEFAL